MSRLIIRRVTKVSTTLDLTGIEVDKLKDQLASYGYLEEITDFDSLDELISATATDQGELSLLFSALHDLCNPVEEYLEGEIYSIEKTAKGDL